MRIRPVCRGGTVGVAVAATLVLGAVPASAEPGDSSAYVADVALTLPGRGPVDVGPLAPASSDGTRTAQLPGIDVDGVLTAGLVTSSAELNEETGGVTARADLTDVGLGLPALSGRIDAVSAACEAGQHGTHGWSNLAGVDLPGVAVPADPEPNTKVALPMTTVVFNEQVTNDDGSLTVNAVRIEPHAVSGSGHVVLGQVRCGVPCPPVPLASGPGLWLGLGVLGLAAIPGGLVLRRRRAASAA